VNREIVNVVFAAELSEEETMVHVGVVAHALTNENEQSPVAFLVPGVVRKLTFCDKTEHTAPVLDTIAE
jgi:hypothetical protein